MNILHYSLGFPPYRTGGLTKYCNDLMEMQASLGNTVNLLWPGEVKILYKDVKIKKHKSNNNINSYEIINPLPVPLLEGINRPKQYIKQCNKKVYEKFLENIKPEIVHIHTFMGLHKEFLEACKEKKIKIVFTSHDYFGICPKVNLLDYNNCECEGIDGEKCLICSKNALSNKKIYIMQSKLYRTAKNTSVLKKIRHKVKESQTKGTITNDIEDNINEARITEYKELKQYYEEMFEKIDTFYFNSQIAYQIYKKHIKIPNYHIVQITHKNIKKRMINKVYFDEEKLKIGYIGPKTSVKGFYNLIKVLDNIKKEGLNFELNVYFEPDNNLPAYVQYHEKFNYENMNEVFENIDVLVVPSIWKETFGFVVLEAISFGCPVICSSNVGASCLIQNNDIGYIYNTEKDLEEVIKEVCLSKEKIVEWSNNIKKRENICTDMTEHTKKILSLYKE